MRIWDIEPKNLCRKHLLAEHRELHGLWNILVIHNCSGGYARHPETLRWVGKQRALWIRHELIVKEFFVRGYCHHTPLDEKEAIGLSKQHDFINPLNEQREILKEKKCDCFSD